MCAAMRCNMTDMHGNLADMPLFVTPQLTIVLLLVYVRLCPR